VLRFLIRVTTVGTKPEVLLYENLTKTESLTENSIGVNFQSHKTSSSSLKLYCNFTIVYIQNL
jgi:hypothetical protein